MSPITESAIVTTIYAGVQEPTPWKSFLHHLRLYLDCDDAVMSLRPVNTHGTPRTVWDRKSPISEEEWKLAAEEHLRLADSDPLGSALQKPGDLYILDEVTSREELTHTEFYAKLMRPYNIEYQLGMYLSEPGGWRCQVGVMNGPDKENFDEDTKKLFRILQPHLERALEFYSLIKENELKRNIYRDILDKLIVPIILLDEKLEIVELNDSAKMVIKNNSLISIVDKHIVFSKKKWNQEFSHIITEAFEWEKSGLSGPYINALRMEDPSEKYLNLVVRTIPKLAWYESEKRPNIMIYINDVEKQFEAPVECTAKIFGLTMAEANLATLLVDGYSLSVAAERLGITYSTARTYSKRIYEKMKVNRQAELVGMILKSAVVMAK